MLITVIAALITAGTAMIGTGLKESLASTLPGGTTIDACEQKAATGPGKEFYAKIVGNREWRVREAARLADGSETSRHHLATYEKAQTEFDAALKVADPEYARCVAAATTAPMTRTEPGGTQATTVAQITKEGRRVAILDVIVQIAAVIAGIAAVLWLLVLGFQIVVEEFVTSERDLLRWFRRFALWERDRWWDDAHATFRWAIALPLLVALLTIELPFYSFWHETLAKSSWRFAQVWHEDVSVGSYGRFMERTVGNAQTDDPVESLRQTLKRVGFWHDFAHAGLGQILITIFIGFPLMIATIVIVLALIVLWVALYLASLLLWVVLYCVAWLLSGLLVFATDIHFFPTLLCPLLARWPLYPLATRLLGEMSPADSLGLPSVRESRKLARQMQRDTQSIQTNTDLAQALNAHLRRLQRLIK